MTQNALFQTILAAFVPERAIGAFQATVTIEENSNDELEITSHPVQQGASITDHSYMKPAMLTVRALYTDNPSKLVEVYAQLQKMQTDRIPMKVVTGKRTYNNMLMRSLSQTNGSTSENILQVSFDLQEVFITALEVASVPPRERQAQPENTGKIEQAGKKAVQEATKQEDERVRQITGRSF
jgi:hypothetical protein